ncbi:MAG: heme lyase CcmF/NrfE family subunit [Pelagibacterales bacterium]|nr:heme lyase CcmF/NrfE family subunit [Pelagibacterales bacterium]
MAPTFGFAFLLMVFSVGVFLPCFNFFSLKRKLPIKIQELKNISVALSSILLICALLSQFSLIYSFVISDYSVSNVYQNSHQLKPLIYKISGSWGNHEGSMLLLITILALYTFAFAILSKTDDKEKTIIISSQSLIISSFAAFTAFSSNPFARIFPAPKNGLGLNPILQDIGLALHPPMLYTGYIGFSLVFSFVIAGLITTKIDKNFAARMKNWLAFSYAFLTLGIGLGSWWAYRELGWGGYWFWDPVENISLMPWIAATALIHCLKTLEKKETFKIWTSFLAILSFILCLLGIFLVRSGILTSVHSFAIDAQRGFFVIALITLIGGLGMLIFCNQFPKLKSEELKFAASSKIGAILLNNYFLILSLFIVVLGTLYPLFSQSIFNQFISIGPNYYNKLFSILIIPFLLFLAISYHLHYQQKTNLSKIVNKINFIILFFATATTCLTFNYNKSAHLLHLIILFLAILVSFFSIFFLSKIFLGIKKTSLLSKISTKEFLNNIPISMAHLGFSLVIIGIILTSSFGLTKEVNIKENESVKISNYEIKFVKIDYIKGSNFIAREGNFEITKNNKFYATLKPQLRYYPISDQTTNEASIKNGFFGDLYLALGQKDESNFYALRIYTKPFIYLIWLGCLMIFGGVVSSIIFRIIFRFTNSSKP